MAKSGGVSFFIRFCVFTIMGMNINSLWAQGTGKVKSKWQFDVQPYLMFPALKGTAGLGTLPDASVDANAGDVFNHLQIGAMLYFEAHNDKWAITNDILYMHLNQDVSSKNGILSGEVNVKQFVWEAGLLRKIIPGIELGVGGRINNLQNTLDLQTTNRQWHKSLTKTWFDPIIIGRAKYPIGKKFFAQLRADLGGFGVGSKFTWQIQADAGYRLVKHFQVELGYRAISVNYEKGSGENRFLYNMNTIGPVVKFDFNF